MLKMAYERVKRVTQGGGRPNLDEVVMVKPPCSSRVQPFTGVANYHT